MGIDIETIFDIGTVEELHHKDEEKQIQEKSNDYMEIIKEINKLELQIKEARKEERKDLIFGLTSLLCSCFIAGMLDNDMIENLVMGACFLGTGAILNDTKRNIEETNKTLVPKLEELYEEYPELKNEKPKVKILKRK